ncbi:hypothetical protein MIPYR_20154 [uncultured Microbacterium sp.]|uniref:NAD(P)-binding domain-containing protein n=1 Tax=uncultured Microbacterium sp. TaxID=191216 RepID=A0A1Y5NZ52_9MICO|nr:hypothetical protein MIPYR_20154 [uncultured Microbacterium sp.]
MNLEIAHAQHLARPRGASSAAERPRVAVTGSTGALGGDIAARLAAAGIPQLLLVRDRSRAPELPATTVVESRYDDPRGATLALQGIDVLLMVSASESADRLAQHEAFVDAAAAAGVAHVVYTSFQGAAPDATFTLARDHHATEERIKASGMAWTMLRDSFYLDFLPLLAGEDGVIRGPASGGRVAAVARADVARTAARILERPDTHRGATYDLTGPEALSLHDVARTLTAVGGAPCASTMRRSRKRTHPGRGGRRPPGGSTPG